MSALAEEMTADYMRNLAAMGIDTIDHFPRATDNIDEIIKLTQTLIDKGFAYASDGDVYFDVAKDPEYGKLSNRDVEPACRAKGARWPSASARPPTSPCGKAPSRASPRGTAPGAKAGPAGTSSARP